MPTPAELLAIDPLDVTDNVLDRMLAAGGKEVADAAFRAAYERAYNHPLSGVRDLANAAQRAFSRHLADMVVEPDRPIDPVAEQARAARNFLRVQIQGTQYLRSLVKSANAMEPRDITNHTYRLPALPQMLVPRPSPAFKSVDPALYLKGWLAKREDVLLDASKVRVRDRNLYVRPGVFSVEELDVLWRWESQVIEHINCAFEPVSPQCRSSSLIKKP